MGLLTEHNCNIQEIPDFGCIFNVSQYSVNVYMHAYEKMLGQKISKSLSLSLSPEFHIIHRAMINALMDKRLEITDQCFERFVRGARALEYPGSDFPYFKFVPSHFHLIGLSSVLNDIVRDVTHPYTSRAWDGKWDFWLGCKWIGRENFIVLIYPDKYNTAPWFEIKATVRWDC